jgi:peptidoglycan/xylan/chitin deacetylase (PgdA/CDA1 family)
MAIALGIDFEHIHHTPAYRSLTDPDPIQIDIPAVTTELLNLFDRHDVPATFFVVSELAAEYPEVIRQIANCGHEIASHTQTHQSVVNCGNAQLSEIDASKSQLESTTGGSVRGFRAPTCQIDDGVYDRLIAAGYEYSSSVMPWVPVPGFYSNEYGFEGPTLLSDGTESLVELPLSVNPYLRAPVSGAWVRMLGRTYTAASIRQLLARDTEVITYSHPWEFVPLQDTPLPVRNRIRTGDWFRETFEQLLQFDATYCRVSDLAVESDSTPRYMLSGEADD